MSIRKKHRQSLFASATELAFKESVDDYLVWCESEGVEPEKPYSGKFNVRLPPQLHRQMAILAKKRHMSLNSFVEKALADEVALLQRAHKNCQAASRELAVSRLALDLLCVFKLSTYP